MPEANRSIEIPSPRLHCIRTAYYRSIIIPLACLRVMEVPLPYPCSWSCLPDRRIAAQCQGNVSVEAVQLSRFMAKGCLYKQRQMDSPDFQPCIIIFQKRPQISPKPFPLFLFIYFILHIPHLRYSNINSKRLKAQINEPRVLYNTVLYILQ